MTQAVLARKTPHTGSAIAIPPVQLIEIYVDQLLHQLPAAPALYHLDLAAWAAKGILGSNRTSAPASFMQFGMCSLRPITPEHHPSISIMFHPLNVVLVVPQPVCSHVPMRKGGESLHHDYLNQYRICARVMGSGVVWAAIQTNQRCTNRAKSSRYARHGEILR